jgi:4-hydroxybenzoate polyprenyltransferase
MMENTDIQFKGRLLRHAPAWLKPYIMLMRIDRPVGVLLLLWPCYWSILLAAGGVLNLHGYGWKMIALFTLGAFLMRSAGCVINDIWDRRLDGKVARTALRPLASGALRLRHALAVLAALLALSLIILLTLPLTAILLGVLSLCFVALYPAMKRVTYWPQLFLGFTFNFGALMGWAAIEGRVSLAALFLYVAGIFWTLGYDTIYGYQDKEDDALIGVKSTALKFGEDGPKWVYGFYGASLAFFVLAGGCAHAGLGFFALSVGAYLYFMRQLQGWQPHNPQNCLKLFKQNMFFGFWLALACAAF